MLINVQFFTEITQLPKKSLKVLWLCLFNFACFPPLIISNILPRNYLNDLKSDLYGVLNANLTNRKLKLNKRINTGQSQKAMLAYIEGDRKIARFQFYQVLKRSVSRNVIPAGAGVHFGVPGLELGQAVSAPLSPSPFFLFREYQED